MLPKNQRVDRKTINQIFEKGRFLPSNIFNFKYILDKATKTPRISFVAPKSVAKHATKRNSLRRRGYIVLKSYLPHFPASVQGVFVYKKDETDTQNIARDIEKTAKSIK